MDATHGEGAQPSMGETVTDPRKGGVELLIVEDNPDDARFVERLVAERRSAVAGEEPLLEITAVDHVDRLGDAIERLGDRRPDVVLLDLMLPDSRGLETVERMVEATPSTPVVVLTGSDGARTGVEAVRLGAQDYLQKGSITGELLHRTLRYAIERERNQRELRDRNARLELLNRIVRRDIRNDVSMIVGWSDQLRERVGSADEPAVEAVLEAARNAVELTDTAAELIEALSIDELSLGPTDLGAIVEEEVGRFERERDVEVAVERTVEGPAVVRASPMVGSVIAELLALVADAGGPRLTVSIGDDDDRVSVAVAGEGELPDAHRRALVGQAPDGRAGMDVALYLVATLVERYGGELGVEDGTTVTLALDRPADD